MVAVSIIHIEAHDHLIAMRWNAADMFVSTVHTEIPGCPPAGQKDNHTLLFAHFFATSLLPSGDQYWDVKFSGNDDVGNNTDPVSKAVDAYAHPTVADTFGDILFADLQGKFSSAFYSNYMN